MRTFDYTASAELFIRTKGKRGVRQPLSYRRFATAAEAIRFAVEDFPAIRTLVHGCGWEMCASTVMTSGACTTATAIHGAVACGSRVEICTGVGLTVVDVAMTATLGAYR